MKIYKQLILSLLFFWVYALSAQEQLNYIQVLDTNGAVLNNASLIPLNHGLARFSNDRGVIALSKKAQEDEDGFLISAPRFNPTVLSIKRFTRDTINVVLSPYGPSLKTEETRKKGFAVMRDVFINDQEVEKKIENQVVQKRILNLNHIPVEVAGLSGRFIPSKSDSGKVLGAIRWSDIDFVNQRKYQEEILGSIDSGLFKEFQAYSVLDMVWDVESRTFNVSPLSNLEYKSPLKVEFSKFYDYYLVDSIQLGDKKAYRIDFEVDKEFAPFFQGTFWLGENKSHVFEAHLKLKKENYINFADSLDMHFYLNNRDEIREGNAQLVEAWLNILDYKLKLDVSTILLDTIKSADTSQFYEKFRVLEFPKKQNKDTLTYFSSLLNGNIPITDGLSSKHGIRSKDYLVKNILDDKGGAASAFFLTGANYHFGHGYIELVPFFLSQGFNTVEGWFINYRTHYRFVNDFHDVRFSPYLRYGFASRRMLPRVEFDYSFNPQNPMRVILEAGAKYQQFNALEPIDPFINTIYSIVLSRNYLKIYQKEYFRFVFDHEIIRGLEMKLSYETARRTALFNNTSFTLVGDGSGYERNNPDHPPEITKENGFPQHRANIATIEMYYQFGQRYDFRNNKLTKLKSPLPRVYFMYRRGFGFDENTPNFNFIKFGIGSKTRFKNFGLFESDFTIGGFYNVDHIEFPDFQHFNGVQTAFINRSYDGATDVRQFSTLPYYDYSTRDGFAELHLKHRFLGWLLSKPDLIKQFRLQSYIGTNYLYVSNNVGQYGEVYFGVENIFRVFNVQMALGLSDKGDVRFGFLLGFSFDYMVYLNAKSR